MAKAPPRPPRSPRGQLAKYKPQDVRFTAKGDTLYAFVMGWPADGKAVIKTLAKGAAAFPKDIGQGGTAGRGRGDVHA